MLTCKHGDTATRRGTAMPLRRLCKSGTSNRDEDCEAIYVSSPARMVAQGKKLDDATASEMQHVAADEDGVDLPIETVLRASAIFLAEQGRPAMMAEVEAFLAEWDPYA
jgi:hypothetical protein